MKWWKYYLVLNCIWLVLDAADWKWTNRAESATWSPSMKIQRPLLTRAVTSMTLGDYNSDFFLDLLVSGEIVSCISNDNAAIPTLQLLTRNGGALEDSSLSKLPDLVNIRAYGSSWINRPGSGLNIIYQSGTHLVMLEYNSTADIFAEATAKLVPGVDMSLANPQAGTIFVRHDFSLPPDGLEDLIVLSEKRVLILTQNSNGTFSDTTTSGIFSTPPPLTYPSTPATWDVNLLDGPTGNESLLIAGYALGSGIFATFYSPENNGSWVKVAASLNARYEGNVAMADFSGDGYADVALTGKDSSFVIGFDLSLNLRNRTFLTSGAFHFNITVPGLFKGAVLHLDLNGDSLEDLFLSGSLAVGDPVSIYLENQGGGNFSLGYTLIGMTDNGAVFSSNMSGANVPGLVQTGLPSNITETGLKSYQAIYHLTNSGLEDKSNDLFPPFNQLLALLGGSCAIFDINGDNISDIHLTGINSRSFYSPGQYVLSNVLLGDGNGTFQYSSTFPAGAVYKGLNLWHDFNKDGSVDHLYYSLAGTGYDTYITKNISALWNISFTPPPAAYTSDSVAGLALDLNQDSWLDVLWTGPVVSPAVYCNQQNLKNTTFWACPELLLPALTSTDSCMVAWPSADFFLVSQEGGLRVREPNGTYVLYNSTRYFLGTQPLKPLLQCTMTLLEVNGDNRMDLFQMGAQAAAPYTLQLFLSLPNDTFVFWDLGVYQSLVSGEAISAALDLDGDGLDEILFSGKDLTQFYALKFVGNLSLVDSNGKYFDGNGTLVDISAQYLPGLEKMSFGSICTGSFNPVVDNRTDFVIAGRVYGDCGPAIMISQTTINKTAPVTSTTGAAALTSSANTAVNAAQDSGSNALSTEALAGIVAGSAGGVLLLLCLALCLLCCFCCVLLAVVAVLLVCVVLVALVAMSVGGMALGGFAGVDVIAARKILRRRKHGRISELVVLDLLEPEAVQDLLEQAQDTDEFQVLDWNELQIIRKIGEGAFGEVMLAEWNGVEVALKLFRNPSETVLDEFRHEALMMAKVSHHPNVVHFVGAAFRDDSIAMVMLFCAGGSLLSALEKHRLNLNQKRHVVAQTASALAFLHSLGIIHRDIAARNVLLDAAGNAKLADLGLSRILEGNQVEQTTASYIGPVRWMSPEALSSRVYSPASDAYSFGTLLAEVYADGAVPYADVPSVANVAVEVLENKRTPDISPEMPQEIASLTRMLWSHDPKNRPTMTDVLKVLANFSTDSEEEDSDSEFSSAMVDKNQHSTSTSNSETISSTYVDTDGNKI